MAQEIYQKLRERVDQYTHGFGATESGIEIKILQRLFTEEEADMYLNLSEKLQTAKEIAVKTGRDPDEVEAILQCMTKKGHTLPRFPKKEGEPFYYRAAPWAYGIWEHNARNMDKETAEMVIEYHQKERVVDQHSRTTRWDVPIRNVPVNAAIPDPSTLAPFDDVKSILLSKDRFGVTDCACYDVHRNAGDSCDQRKEVCMMFDFYADYHIALGMGRPLTRDEALTLLEECEKDGLVHTLTNSENPEFICNCCSDCCVVLKTYKRLPKPALAVLTNYYTQVDTELCSGCETCVDRCPMDAVAVGPDDIAAINSDRCIGCGVCISTCSEEALSLKAKPDEQREVPPPSISVARPSKEIEDSMLR